MDSQGWLRRLESTFVVGGVVGGRLLRVMRSEESYGSYVASRFHGYYVLTDSFLSFYMETLQLAEKQYCARPSSPRVPSYASILLAQVGAFRVFRAAETLLARGYPLSGYSLIRELKDKAVFLAAIANGFSTYESVYGIDGISSRTKQLSDEEHCNDVRKRSMREQQRVWDLMAGKNSQLKKDEIEHLRIWAGMFNQEVHGARLTTYVEGENWMKGKSPLPILPQPELTAIGMYLNRSNEVAWMLLRTLPFLQLRSSAFGSEWAEKWTVLDESFRHAVASVVALGKPVVASLMSFIEAKFSSSPATTTYKDPSS